jgi:hypothetical protein
MPHEPALNTQVERWTTGARKFSCKDKGLPTGPCAQAAIRDCWDITVSASVVQIIQWEGCAEHGSENTARETVLRRVAPIGIPNGIQNRRSSLHTIDI